MSDRDLALLLSEGLDLCVRARRMDEIEKERAEYYLLNPEVTRSLTIPLWAEEQYQKDLADWESRVRSTLSLLALSGYIPIEQLIGKHPLGKQP